MMAAGDREGANQLLTMHMRDELGSGRFPLETLNELVGAFIGVAVAAADYDPAKFRAVSAALAEGKVLG